MTVFLSEGSRRQSVFLPIPASRECSMFLGLWSLPVSSKLLLTQVLELCKKWSQMGPSENFQARFLLGLTLNLQGRRHEGKGPSY